MSVHISPMTTLTGLKLLHVAILKVETLAIGRSRVTFRTTATAANPSGIETANTGPLWTEEGRAVTAELRRRTRTWPMTLLRTTVVGISFQQQEDGSTLRIISDAGVRCRPQAHLLGYRRV